MPIERVRNDTASPRPRGVMKEILDSITEIVLHELSARDACLYRQYQEGLSMQKIAKDNQLSIAEVRLLLFKTDHWLAERFTMHRLHMLVQIPLTLENAPSEELLLKLGAIRLDTHLADCYMANEKDETSLRTPIESLKIITRSLHVLYTAQVKSVEELCEYSREELMSVRNSGEKTVQDIEAALKALGLGLKIEKNV